MTRPAPRLGEHDGLSYALFLPEGAARDGRADPPRRRARPRRATSTSRAWPWRTGIAALAYDARGHGRSDGAFGPGAIDDVLAMLELLRGWRGVDAGGRARLEHGRLPGDPAARPRRRRRRGGRHLPGARGPAAAGRALRTASRASRPTARRSWPGCRRSDVHDGGRARSARAPRCSCSTPRATSRCPTRCPRSSTPSPREPKRLLILPGGHHRSLQHDLEIQAESLKFIERAVRPSRPLSRLRPSRVSTRCSSSGGRDRPSAYRRAA